MRKFRRGDIVKTASVLCPMTVVGYQKLAKEIKPLNPYVFDSKQLDPEQYSDTMVECCWEEGRAEYIRVFHQDLLQLVRPVGE